MPAPTSFTDAGVGLGRLLSSDDVDAGRRLLIDDVSVRPLVEPEPLVTVRSRLNGDGQPCATDAQCVSRRCDTVCSSGEDAGAGDAGVIDAGLEDAGPGDAGLADAGAPDAGDVGDAGVAPLPGEYVVGCGCGSVDGVLALLAVVIARRRRRASTRIEVPK